LGASLSSTDSSVTVRTGTAKSGTISVIYTVRDATDTAARQVQGRITVIVASAPEPVTDITLSNPGSQTVDVVFGPPSSSNGAEVTSYTVQVVGSPGIQSRTDCLPGATCRFSGLTNGASQTVTVSATNKVATTLSGQRSITPYGTPGAPNGASASNGPAGAGYVNLNWGATPDLGGGAPDYQWRQLPSGGWNSVGGALSASPSIGVGNTASFEVRVCNSGGLCSSAVASNAATAPPPPPSGYIQNGGYIGFNSGFYYHWLNLCVSNLAPGNYTINFYSDADGLYATGTYSLPANGCVGLNRQGGTDTQNGKSTDWFQMEVVGQFTTPQYRPWS